MKVLLLSGGKSEEREISLLSAANVGAALEELGHEIIHYDPGDGLIALEQFYGNVDVVFPILHGGEGEDGTIQKQLERIGLPFLGAGSTASKLCFDKLLFKQALEPLGIKTPAWDEVTMESFQKSYLIKQPFVLKPIASGSSIDTYIVRQPKKMKLNLDDIFARHKLMLLEELIIGDEITVGIVGDQALPVIEIIPPYGEEFDYSNKYNGMTAEHCPPLHVSEALQSEAKQMALKIHQELGVRHLSRTDFMINTDGQIYCLELNTIPGLTKASLIPKAASKIGLDMPGLVSKLLDLILANK